MKKPLFLLLLIAIRFQLNAQTLNTALETLDPNITYAKHGFRVNEDGSLYCAVVVNDK